MAAAMADVKRDFGRDAVILRSRCVRKGALLGLLGGKWFWEIQAAPAGDAPVAFPGRYVPSEAEPESPAAVEARREVAQHFETHLPTSPTRMAVQMEEIREMVRTLLSRGPGGGTETLPAPLAAAAGLLAAQDVSEAIAVELIAELRRSAENQPELDEQRVQNRLTDLIADRLPTAPGHEIAKTAGPRVISLIGPTGVGKTTTIAKLAANLKLREGKSVGLITIDTYRIAAVDQLRTYAQIIQVPLRPVLTAGELHQAIREMSDCDVVLIDTAGRSHKNELRLNELRRFLAAAEADEVHLVISASSSARVGQAALRHFAPLGANRIIITKLDEAETFGIILNIAAATDATVSYVTTGQDVPDDIAPAEARRLARCIVKGSWDAS